MSAPAAVTPRVVALLAGAGELTLLLRDTLGALRHRPFRGLALLKQMLVLGVHSLPVVSVTAVFTGMVLALQTAYQLKKFGAEMYVGGIVGLSMARELGPVLTSLMVAGRVGAGIAASLGTMQVTEQVDALKTMGTDPVRYLVLPRFLAMLLMLPLLAVLADFIGYLGGYLVGVHWLGVNPTLFVTGTARIVAAGDIVHGLIKAAVFGGIIALSGCYAGLKARGGAEGVGRATTAAVVLACMLILISNYFLTALLYIF